VFCESSFTLHRQQLENVKQNVDVAPLWKKILPTPKSRPCHTHAMPMISRSLSRFVDVNARVSGLL